MVSYNQCIFTGQVRWCQEKQIGESWGIISTRVILPKFEFSHKGETQTITEPFVWLGIKTNYDANGLKQKNLLSDCQNNAYIMVSAGVVSDYETVLLDENKKPIAGAPPDRRFKLETSPYSVSTSEIPMTMVNECTFSGHVENVDSNGWMLLTTSYKVKTETKYRRVEVLCEPSLINPALQGSNALIIGSVCGKTPKRDQRLYVVARQIFQL